MFDLSARYAHGLKARYRRTIPEWARANIEIGSWSPWPGPWSTERSPQIVEPLERLGEPGPKECDLEGPAAGGKSTIGETFLSFVVDNMPGFTAWYCQDEDAAKEFAETRIQPFLDSSEAVRRWFPGNRHQRRTKAINFPHMSFVVQAANRGNAQSKHIRHLIMDEPWLYKPGLATQLHKRTTRFAHNRTVLRMSTGSVKGDEFNKSWLRGSKQFWQHRCPECKRLHIPRWSVPVGQLGGVNWSQDAKLADGTWDEKTVSESTTYQCPLCGTSFAANAANGYALAQGGRYTDPAANMVARHWSFHWDSLLTDFSQLGTIALEYLDAKTAETRGTSVLFQEFKQKKLAEAWEEEPPEVKIADLDSGYNMGDPWEEEVGRMMAVDVQQTHFWVVIRSFNKSGHSRLVACARLESWDSVREFQVSHAVNNDCVLVDSGKWADDVYTMCCFYGWNAIKGEAVPGGYREKQADGRFAFLMARTSADAHGRPIPYYPAQLKPGSASDHCYLTLVSDELSSEVLSKARAGKVIGFTLARDTPKMYRDQIASVQRRGKPHHITNQVVWSWVIVGKAGNHLWDGERYIMAGMFVAGFFLFTDTPRKTQDKPANEPEPAPYDQRTSRGT